MIPTASLLSRGGRKFRVLKLAQTARQELDNKILERTERVAPVWLNVLEKIPPSNALVRPPAIQLKAASPRLNKPKRTYMPQEMEYEEDELRATFFKDHPWELARPRIIIEMDGKDRERFDWSTGLVQKGLALTGESVVQRQMWLMKHSGLTKDQAYDVTRREFYRLRHFEEVEKRVAVEEARMMGAYFGPSALQAGLMTEDRMYELWKPWAASQIELLESARGSSYVSFGDDTETDQAVLDDLSQSLGGESLAPQAE